MTRPDPLLDPPAWAPSWLPTVDDLRGIRVLRWVIGAVFVAGLAGCVSEGADQPADPVVAETTGSTGATTTAGAAGAAGGLAERFGTVAARLVDAAGEVVELCLLHADTADERAQGLMQVTDLEGHDGMLFTVEAPTTGAFYMYRTVLPLTIGWWADQGGFVSRADMAPCTSDDPATCERFPPGGAWRWAIEVPQGDPLAERFRAGTALEVAGQGCPA